MTWTVSTGVDISHYQTITDYARARSAVDWVQIKVTEGTAFVDQVAATHHRGFAGIPRGAYCFARPNLPVRDQVAHFLARKAAIGTWERPDMLDAEVAGTTGAWVRDLIGEYRRQSGRRLVLVYSPVDPTDWWDDGCVIWRARYRRIGPPNGPDDWARHLGWDHPGLGIYQWDDNWPLPGGPRCDINSQRVALGVPTTVEDDMSWGDDLTILSGTPGYTTGEKIKAAVMLADTLAVAHRVELQNAGLLAAVNKLATAVANDDDVTADELRAVVREAMASVVQVQVSVVDGDPPGQAT